MDCTLEAGNVETQRVLPFGRQCSIAYCNECGPIFGPEKHNHPQPPSPSQYSPDSNPPEYFLFPKLKLELKGDHYDIVEDIQKSMTRKLNRILEISVHVSDGVQLGDHAKCYTETNMDYFE